LSVVTFINDFARRNKPGEVVDLVFSF